MEVPFAIHYNIFNWHLVLAWIRQIKWYYRRVSQAIFNFMFQSFIAFLLNARTYCRFRHHIHSRRSRSSRVFQNKPINWLEEKNTNMCKSCCIKCIFLFYRSGDLSTESLFIFLYLSIRQIKGPPFVPLWCLVAQNLILQKLLHQNVAFASKPRKYAVPGAVCIIVSLT